MSLPSCQDLGCIAFLSLTSTECCCRASNLACHPSFMPVCTRALLQGLTSEYSLSVADETQSALKAAAIVGIDSGGSLDSTSTAALVPKQASDRARKVDSVYNAKSPARRKNQVILILILLSWWCRGTDLQFQKNACCFGRHQPNGKEGVQNNENMPRRELHKWELGIEEPNRQAHLNLCLFFYSSKKLSHWRVWACLKGGGHIYFRLTVPFFGAGIQETAKGETDKSSTLSLLQELQAFVEFDRYKTNLLIWWQCTH